ncbi:glutamine synthetase cytosolic isozyme 1-1-like [Neltuma alba]|uniref:glutamine synthetase cytosolic isozyme 1-1-like n=1 Tax=Neltuma alba TaxID=207710 RepID=UPI0010A3D5F8|nr:glutamine synthetase cytosolic isozyme 1-1-like [Prosopis alba]
MEGDGISLADDVWILRYIAEMVASKYELVVFDPNMIPGYDMEAGIRMKFSTQSMRNARGYKEAKRAVDKLEMMHALSGEGNNEFKILPYFDAPVEADGRARPSAFVIDIRMPPSHEMDPYLITSRIARTVRLWKPTIPEILAAKSHTDPFLRAVRSTWSKLKRLRTC